MKETYYFSHDYNARSDIKIKKLIAKHGMVGYGVFWAIVEDLYNNANALPTDYESIAFDIRSECELVKSVVNDFDLFVIDVNTFGSSSVERRLNERNAKSESARQSALKRWESMRSHSDGIPFVLQSQSDGNAIKESKVKEKKGKEKKEFVAPSVQEVQAYFSENGWKPELGTKAYNHYHPDWKNSQGKKVLNWKQTMRTVWMDEGKNGNMKIAAPKSGGVKVPISVNIYDCIVKYSDGTSLTLPKVECLRIKEEYHLD